MKEKDIEIEKAQRLLGIELNLDTMILIAAWYIDYKILFWILLVLFVINMLMVQSRIERLKK